MPIMATRQTPTVISANPLSPEAGCGNRHNWNPCQQVYGAGALATLAVIH